MNNEEYIKNMSTKELAEFISQLTGGIFLDRKKDISWIVEWLKLPKGEKMPPI